MYGMQCFHWRMGSKVPFLPHINAVLEIASISRISVVSVRRSSSSSGCLGKADLFHCCTPWAFHITIFYFVIFASDKLHCS